ncbi:DUF6484 domain-containing protein [Variovorax sp. DXTD-1]|uniref:DUF6484 domain-containing protein n=1 Tax=Variovorax sp. DXTD-1 TaxID=2495592 RepID=UPI000F89D24F|nr:DUF6484 domain-containing protein [Variovorax sp. DXTD-1]RST46404.1 hypothetical protein EJI00_21315 [Variovorax sp. DXTD-1]
MSGRDEALARLMPATGDNPGAMRLGVRVARLAALTGAGPWVRMPDDDSPLCARTTVHLGEEDVGRDVVVAFDGGDPQRPLILGRVLPMQEGPSDAVHAQADNGRLVLSARERIVLRCGSSSITLTRAGKVLIDGHFVQTRATGVNALKGGSIELN